MQWNIACAALLIGFVIGMTGMGGGALMTPVLVIFFGITPTAAISSDVVASVILKPIGGGVHEERIRPRAGIFMPMMPVCFSKMSRQYV